MILDDKALIRISRQLTPFAKSDERYQVRAAREFLIKIGVTP